jgi:predicted lipoprotein with Yx(FWY)xxD motif
MVTETESCRRAQEEEPVMSRRAVAFALTLATTAANAQNTKAEQTHTPAVASANGMRPFLFDGRMQGDGVRRGALANDPPNAGAIVLSPKASQPGRER